MLVGSILFVTWPAILKIFLIYLAVGVLHYLLRQKFLLISMNIDLARKNGLWIRFWDFIFYVTFGIVVTSSVRIAGVLLVFSYLIVPAACAMLFFKRVSYRLIVGWGLGFIGSVLGLYASAKWDLPTGASVVVVFGVILVICAMIKYFIRPSLH